jgi:Outer membrane protein beta-barrel domain
MPFIVALLAILLVAAPARAQSSYIGVSLVGELVRASHVDVDDQFDQFDVLRPESRGGEAIGFGVVAGTALGEKWGVEVEFVSPGSIEQSTTRDLRSILALPGLPGIPALNVTTETEQQHTTVTAAAWVRQELSDKLQLAYLGGISFARSEFESRLNISLDPRILQLLAPVRPQEIETVTLHAGPMAGAEARWKLGDRASIVGGVRLHAHSGVFLIRPSAGVHWRF